MMFLWDSRGNDHISFHTGETICLRRFLAHSRSVVGGMMEAERTCYQTTGFTVPLKTNEWDMSWDTHLMSGDISVVAQVETTFPLNASAWVPECSYGHTNLRFSSSSTSLPQTRDSVDLANTEGGNAGHC